MTDEKKKIWSETYFIHYYETDLTGKLNLQAICNFLQNSAGNHAEHLNIGFDHMRKMNKAWVLSRMKIKMGNYPKFGETINVQTWIRKTDGLFSYRDFHILNTNQEIIGAASFSWVVIDIQTRRPHRIESIIDNFPHFADLQAFNSDIEKIEFTGQLNPVEYYQAKYSDLDINLHVNNVKYIEWALDTYQPEKYMTYDIQQLTVNFISECLYNERVAVSSHHCFTDTHFHGIIRESDKKEVCRIKIEWIKK